MQTHLRTQNSYRAALLAAALTCTIQTTFGQDPRGPSAITQPATSDSETTQTGTLLGRVVFDGPPPAQRNAAPPFANAPDNRPARGIDESLIVGPEGGIANVLLWVRSADIPATPTKAPLTPAILTFQPQRIDPHVLAFRGDRPLRIVNNSGSGVHVKATDSFQSSAAMIAGATRELHDLRAVQIPAMVSSSVQPWFEAWVLPLQHDYFAVTGRDGRFEIKDLPLGRWEFVIWHEKVGGLNTTRFPNSTPAGRFTWQVTPGENDLGDMNVSPALFDK